MKFLIVALCVCAASAAQIGLRNNWQFQPTSQAVATASVTPSSVTATPYPKSYQTVVPSVAKAYSSVVSPVVSEAKAYSVVGEPVYQTVAEPVVQTYSAVKAVPVAKNVYSADSQAQILRSESSVAADGFEYSYETENGISAQQHGDLKNVDNVNVISVKGSYQYQGPDGPVVVTYVADENGYQPSGDVIPTPPPVPVAILRSLEWIASQPKHVEEVPYKKL